MGFNGPNSSVPSSFHNIFWVQPRIGSGRLGLFCQPCSYAQGVEIFPRYSDHLLVGQRSEKYTIHAIVMIKITQLGDCQNPQVNSIRKGKVSDNLLPPANLFFFLFRSCYSVL